METVEKNVDKNVDAFNAVVRAGGRWGGGLDCPKALCATWMANVSSNTMPWMFKTAELLKTCHRFKV